MPLGNADSYGKRSCAVALRGRCAGSRDARCRPDRTIAIPVGVVLRACFPIRRDIDRPPIANDRALALAQAAADAAVDVHPRHCEINSLPIVQCLRYMFTKDGLWTGRTNLFADHARDTLAVRQAAPEVDVGCAKPHRTL